MKRTLYSPFEISSNQGPRCFVLTLLIFHVILSKTPSEYALELFYTYIYHQIVAPTLFYLSCLQPDLNKIWHENTKGALMFHLTNPCDSSPTLLTRTPREGQDPST